MEATRALDSPYSSHCFLDDCVALCWDVWKLSTKTYVEKHDRTEKRVDCKYLPLSHTKP